MKYNNSYFILAFYISHNITIIRLLSPVFISFLFLASVLLMIKILIINNQVTVTSFDLLWRGIYNDMHGHFVYLSPSHVLNLLYILWQAQNYENGSG